jgi:cytochrome b6-f complex iron-sulfur subunit
MSTTGVTRRQFIGTVGMGAVAAAIASQITGITAEASSRSVPVPMEPISLDLAKPDYAALKTVGGAMKIPNPHDKDKPIIVCRTSDTTVAAYSSKCTHFGCEVSLPANNVVSCPCHGSAFDATGKVTHGPAGRDLAPFAAAMEGTVITIKDMPS